MKQKEVIIPENKLELYNKLIEVYPEIERKGVTLPYTSLNGHMFSFLAADGSMGLRLAKEDRDEFIKKYKTTLMEAHGVVMKDYVEVPDELLTKTEELALYLEKSLAHIRTLRPKATIKKQS